MLKPKFCVWCGSALRMRYPGNDPEAGPARLACGVHDQSLEEILGERKPDLPIEIAAYIEDVSTLNMYGEISDTDADGLTKAAEAFLAAIKKCESAQEEA